MQRWCSIVLVVVKVVSSRLRRNCVSNYDEGVRSVSEDRAKTVVGIGDVIRFS
jgi:hypothetical protein